MNNLLIILKIYVIQYNQYVIFIQGGVIFCLKEKIFLKDIS